MIYDVLIIGAGITGCMTAYRLAEYELTVAVAEAACDVAMGATRANSAIVHAGYDPEPDTCKAKLNVQGCAEMPALAQELDVAYKRCGSLVAAFAEEEIPALYALLERGRQNGVPDLAIIGRERLREMEPNLKEEAAAALYAPSAGIICPYGLAIAAAETAAVNGADFYFDFPIEAVTSADGIFTVVSGGRQLRARYLVNAAGIHADTIAALAGEKDFPITLTPRRGEYMLLDKEYGNVVNRPVFRVPTAAGKGILLTPTVDGNMIVGPNAHVVQECGDTATTAEGLEEISSEAAKLVRSLPIRGVVTSFAGIRATPSQGDFYIRPSEQVPGLLHLAGIESPGLASSPAVSRYACELLAEMGLALRPRPEGRKPRPKQLRFHALSDAERTALAASSPSYGKIVCRCETITEGEILDAIHRPLGARTVDMVKRRTRAGMGRCQGGFCSPRVTAILSRELGIPLEAVTKSGGGSYILTGRKD